VAKRRFEGVAGRFLAAAATTAASLLLTECALRAFAPAREVGAAFTQYDPYYGKRLKSSASLVRETPEFTMRFATNRLGFRGPERIGEPHDVLLFLGDSFTLGYGVNDGEEFPARIAEQLGGDPPALNAGIGDAGNGRWLLFLRRDAAPLAPRAVVLQVQENDFADNRRERLFALADGALTALPVPPPSFARRAQVWIDLVPGLAGSHLIGRVRLLVDRPAGAVGGGDGPAGPAADPLTLRLIDAALAECAERGWPALGLLADVRGERERAVAEAFDARGVPIVRIPTKSERPDLYFAVDGHWNAAGHAYAAQVVLAELRAIGVVPR